MVVPSLPFLPNPCEANNLRVSPIKTATGREMQFAR
jgi:hypothetical protein